MIANIVIITLIIGYCIFLIYKAYKNHKEGKHVGCAGCSGNWQLRWMQHGSRKIPIYEEKVEGD